MSQVIITRTPPQSATEHAPPDESQSTSTVDSQRRFPILRWLGHRIPTLLVLASLVGLVIYGHHSDWKLPKFSQLAGTGVEERDDWCEEHAVPESQCVICNQTLLPQGTDFGWCKEHGIHNCPLEHPEVAQTKKTPIATEVDRQRAVRALALTDRPENNSVCKNYRRRIQFASIEAVRKAGVDVQLVDRQPISEAERANGEITYDEVHFASLSSRMPGTVWRVEKNIGDRVQAGEVLAWVDAVEVGRAKTELLQALAQEALQQAAVRRLDSLTNVVAGRQLQEAQARLVQAQAQVLSAQQTLANLGLPVNVDGLRGLSQEERVDRLRWLGGPRSSAPSLNHDEATANLLPLRAPMDGVVVTRQVVAGEVVDTSRMLFQIADTGRMWLTLNVPLEKASLIHRGQSVRFRPDGSREEVVGSLTWISTAADPQTRMVKVRAELPNPDELLRNGTFGAGEIRLREEADAIVVPNEAVHWEGCCHVVFVRDKGYFDKPNSPKVFHVRTVRLGTKNEKHTEILAGVLPGEVVATKGSDVLRAELLKNNLGEGCTCGQ
jgi:cobalt-zinc-cadmium efflux system membrane fusion protein